jgi:hypothetical protein
MFQNNLHKNLHCLSWSGGHVHHWYAALMKSHDREDNCVQLDREDTGVQLDREDTGVQLSRSRGHWYAALSS